MINFFSDDTKYHLYIIKGDGYILPDTQCFLFHNTDTALMTLALFSITYARKDLKLYCIGEMSHDGDIKVYDNSTFCDYNDLIKAVTEFRQIFPERASVSFIDNEYIQRLLDACDKAIQERLFGPDFQKGLDNNILNDNIVSKEVK